MSLDIYLIADMCPTCGRGEDVFWQNITHNLTPMADKAGIYEIVWRPEENGVTSAEQLIAPLEKAIAEMKADPPRFEKLNSPNGWGSYKNFLPWLEKLLAACREHPQSAVRVSR